jgi:hypothetical protein
MRHPAAGVDVFYFQATEFFTALSVIQEGGQQRPVAQAFESFVRRQVHQLPGFLIGDRRRLAFVAVYLGAFDAFDGIRWYRVLVGQVLI